MDASTLIREAVGTMDKKDGVQTDSELEFGSKVCSCPRCGTKVQHALRGEPCDTMKCPRCGSQMSGTQCNE